MKESMSLAENTRNDKLWGYFFLLILCIVSVFFRFQTSNFLKSLTICPDESLYFSIASSIAQGQGISVYNGYTNFQKILYSLVISPAFLAGSKLEQIRLISLINSVVMTSGVLPVYLLANKIVKSKKSVLFICLFYLLLPDLTYSMTFMSEVLFLPLSTWAIYVFYELITCQGGKKKLCLCFLFGTVLYLLYVCKEVSLVFPTAYVLYGIVEPFLDGMPKEKRKNIPKYMAGAMTNVAIVLLVWVALYIAVQYTVFRTDGGIGIMNNYSPTLASFYQKLSFNYIRYMLYGCVYYTCGIFISCGVFPIFMPFLHFEELSRSVKRLFTFLMFLTLISVGVVTYMITLRENLGDLVPSVHLRYVCYLAVPFLICFFSLCEERGTDKNQRTSLYAAGVLAVFLAVFYRGIPDKTSSLVAQTALGYSLHFSKSQVRLFCIALGLAILAGTVLFYKKRRRALLTAFCLLLTLLQIRSNQVMIQSYHTAYQIGWKEYEEIQQVAEMVSEHPDKTFLVVTDLSRDGKTEKTQGIIETYVSYPNVRITSGMWLLEHQLKNGIDLESQALPTFRFNFAYDERPVDYLLLKNEYELQSGGAERLMEGSAYYLYALSDNTQLPPLREWWTLHDGVNHFEIEKGRFYSDYELEDGQFISGEEENFLLYGPYREIPSGKYTITFHYRYEGDAPEGTYLGFVNARSSALHISSTQVEFTAGMDSVSLDMSVPDDCSDFELRMYTSSPGIILESVDIEETTSDSSD